jgi:hypothetical protein
MTETRICPECEMEFDWPGVEVDEEIYCCEACSLGQPCDCPQHQHMMDTTDTMPTVIGQPGTL